MVAKVAGLYDLQSAAARASLQNQMQDNITQIEQGKPVENPVTAAKWAAYMPLTATPEERQEQQKTFDHYQEMLHIQPVFQEVPLHASLIRLILLRRRRRIVPAQR